MLLRHIRYFLAVAAHGNFTRAAEALHVSQPTLSQQIRQIEETLGAQLLDRSGRTVLLTDAGEVYRQHALRAMQALDAGSRAIHDVQALTRGALRLAITPTFTAYLVAPLVERFGQRHPGITLDIREMPQERMEALLSADELDVGIAFSDVQSPDIEAQVLGVEALALVVGQAHPAARRRRVLTLEAFAGQALVLLNRSFATRQHIDRFCSEQGVAAHIAVEVDSISAALEIVRQGRLATVLPAAVAQAHEGLRVVRVEPALPRRTTALLQRRDAYRSAAARAFVAMVLEKN